jgi:hypothetical protein
MKIVRVLLQNLPKSNKLVVNLTVDESYIFINRANSIILSRIFNDLKLINMKSVSLIFFIRFINQIGINY